MKPRRICESCPRWVEDHFDPATGKRCPVCKQPTRGRQAFVIRTTGLQLLRHTLEGRELHDGTQVEYLSGDRWNPGVIELKPWSGTSARTSPIVHPSTAPTVDASEYPVRLSRTPKAAP